MQIGNKLWRSAVITLATCSTMVSTTAVSAFNPIMERLTIITTFCGDIDRTRDHQISEPNAAHNLCVEYLNGDPKRFLVAKRYYCSLEAAGTMTTQFKQQDGSSESYKPDCKKAYALSHKEVEKILADAPWRDWPFKEQ